MVMLMLKFKDRFKNLREELQLNQTQLGLILNVSQKTISNYELGNRFPDEDMLNKIADLFNVSVDYLLGRTEIRNIYKITKP